MKGSKSASSRAHLRIPRNADVILIEPSRRRSLRDWLQPQKSERAVAASSNSPLALAAARRGSGEGMVRPVLKLLLGSLAAALCAACYSESVSQQALVSSNGRLSHAIDRAVAQLVPEASGQDCTRPNPGFTVDYCVFVRHVRPLPFCTRRAYLDGRCRAIELRARLLGDPRVLQIITEASRQVCSYVANPNASGRESRLVIGCHPPSGEEWTLVRRSAPLTICIIGLADGASEARLPGFAIRDGERVRDRWCDALEHDLGL
jgi:hypothetical protein